jgi:Flp pilus assembly protein TadG
VPNHRTSHGLRNPWRQNRKREQGIIIVLVAIFMLGVVGAMAALAIDVTTFYTARSEAQLAADGAALAGARVLANSGMTSDPNAGSDNVASTAAGFCQTVAQTVAQANLIGGQSIASGQVTTTCNVTNYYNPTVTVKVQATLPTFFARIWGSTQVSLSASATAEAYNPTGALGGSSTPVPVQTTCLKPWLLPNLDPSGTSSNGAIFVPATGQLEPGLNLLTWSGATPLQLACNRGNCGGVVTKAPWYFLPGDTATDFPPPTASSVSCSPTVGGFSSTAYELSIAGCVQTPIACNSQVNADLSDYPTRNSETADAVNCLAHTQTSGGDSVDTTNNTPPPFEFLTGNDNPQVEAGAIASNTDVFVSDSIVTVPVFDSTGAYPPANPVQVIGFVQLFLSPLGAQIPPNGRSRGQVSTRVINVVGCGRTGVAGTPVYGNGPSAVPVRLISQ